MKARKEKKRTGHCIPSCLSSPPHFFSYPSMISSLLQGIKINQLLPRFFLGLYFLPEKEKTAKESGGGRESDGTQKESASSSPIPSGLDSDVSVSSFVPFESRMETGCCDRRARERKRPKDRDRSGTSEKKKKNRDDDAG